ncbi:MAG: phage tail protein [Plesiomonas shigelloides]
MMANESLLNQVTVRGQKIMAHDLPQLLGFTAIDYLVNNSDDMTAVAEQANGASQGAYDAQETNDRQDETLADHSETLANHGQRISAAEETLQDHANRIDTLEITSADHEKRIGDIEADYVSKSATGQQKLASSLDVNASYSVNGVKVVGERVTGWVASTGTPYTSIFNGDKTNTAGATYSQTVLQAIADDLKQARQRIIALEGVLRSHGLLA